MLGLQALSEYNIQSYARRIDLRNDIRVTSNSSLRHSISLSDGDMAVQKSVQDVSSVKQFLQLFENGHGVKVIMSTCMSR